MLLSDGQRRLLFMLTGAGLAMIVAALVVQPRGATYWIAVCLAPLLVGGVGYVAGGRAARSIDARLLAAGGPRQAWKAPPPAELSEASRAALQAAMVPALLAELADRAQAMKPPQRSAAERLLGAARAAWATMPPGAERAAFARDLPALITSLTQGSDAAVAQAARLAALLAAPRAPAAPSGGQA